MTEAIKNSSKAIWSLVLGILSMICLGCLAGVPAVICGHKAMSEIKKSGGLLTGEGMALAGLILGYISIGLSVVVIPLYMAIAIPSFVKIRNGAQTSTCQNGQRLVVNATEEWAAQNNIAEGATTDVAAVTAFLKNNELPKCPANNMPIAIPAKVGDSAVCPDPSVTDEHTLP